jgi:hypothetical protein
VDPWSSEADSDGAESECLMLLCGSAGIWPASDEGNEFVSCCADGSDV